MQVRWTRGRGRGLTWSSVPCIKCRGTPAWGATLWKVYPNTKDSAGSQPKGKEEFNFETLWNWEISPLSESNCYHTTEATKPTTIIIHDAMETDTSCNTPVTMTTTTTIMFSRYLLWSHVIPSRSQSEVEEWSIEVGILITRRVFFCDSDDLFY